VHTKPPPENIRGRGTETRGVRPNVQYSEQRGDSANVLRNLGTARGIRPSSHQTVATPFGIRAQSLNPGHLNAVLPRPHRFLRPNAQAFRKPWHPSNVPVKTIITPQPRSALNFWQCIIIDTNTESENTGIACLTTQDNGAQIIFYERKCL
jgi:hypothetical protein